MSLDRENVLEAGFILFGAGVMAGLGLLIAGRLVGRSQRQHRHGEPAPRPGLIPSERHQQLATSPR